MTCEKNWPFSSFMRNNECLHELPQKKLRYFLVPGYRADWSFSIMAWISPTNLGVLFLSEWSEWFFWATIALDRTGLLQLYLNPLHCPQIDTQTLWNLHIGSSSMNAKQYSVPFLHLRRIDLCHSAAFLTDSAKLTLVCCTIDKT